MIIKNVEESITDETLNRLREMLQIKRKKFEDGLKAYTEIQAAIQNATERRDKICSAVDSITDKYKNFYQLRRRDKIFIEKYFLIMKDAFSGSVGKRNLSGDENALKETFCKIISKLHECGTYTIKATGERKHTFEISFTSKLLHTIDQNLPIWDSIVAEDHFKMSAGKEMTAEARWSAYKDYKDKFENYVNDENRGRILIELFDEKYGEI